MAPLILPLGDELARHLAAMTRRTPRLAEALARQVLAAVEPVALAGLLLTPELATDLLVKRLQSEPERTVRELDQLRDGTPGDELTQPVVSAYRAQAGEARWAERESARRVHPWSRPGRRPASFLKWAGSKAQVMPFILRAMPRTFGTYFEPMVGSGTVFFALRPERAVLSDINAELMNCYEVICNQLEALLRALGRHENSREHFLRMRAEDPAMLAPVERAARTIYLNKTCFNGLYRVNASGQFNVPYGGIAHARIRDEETLRKAHKSLQSTVLRCRDYADCLRDVRRGDLVYLDPPYLSPDGPAKTFSAYQPNVFEEDEHRRLAEVFRALDRRGCQVLLSNSDVPLVRRLYRGYRIQVIPTRRMVHPDPSRRAGWDEVLVDNRG